jgi:cytochrome c peroxidase
MKKRNYSLLFLTVVLLGGFIYSCNDELLNDNPEGLVLKSAGEAELTDMELLGKKLFFDKNLSANKNQSCATCHAPEAGWVGPHNGINAHGAVYEGSVAGAFGDRKPPSAAYGGESPILYMEENGLWVGGMFWDGRASGWVLGDPLAEQAKGPYLNPMEQALPDANALIAVIKASDYADLFGQLFPGSLEGNVDEAYDNVGRAVAAYERSDEVNPFSSKFDAWLQGKAKLTPQEHRGKAVFHSKGKCDLCHLIKGTKPLFTDFTYDNLGIPKNLENPYTISHPDWADPGLGGFLKSINEESWEDNLGKHKVPTLRNVDLRPSGLVKAYGHNGYFKSLEEIVHFYNTRDVPGAGWNGMPWPEPEVSENVNTAELGNLGLTEKQEADLVAFLKTLSDGYLPE